MKAERSGFPSELMTWNLSSSGVVGVLVAGSPGLLLGLFVVCMKPRCIVLIRLLR